jgi:hypothetical protein
MDGLNDLTTPTDGDDVDVVPVGDLVTAEPPEGIPESQDEPTSPSTDDDVSDLKLRVERLEHGAGHDTGTGGEQRNAGPTGLAGTAEPGTGAPEGESEQEAESGEDDERPTPIAPQQRDNHWWFRALRT